MLPFVPRSKTQMWLARAAILSVLLLLIALKLSSFQVLSVQSGPTVIYSSPRNLPIICGLFGLVVAVVAVVFWMQHAILFRVISVFIGLMALYILLISPTGLNHRLTLSPESLQLRLGYWFSPADTAVDFSTLAYLSVDKSNDGDYEITGLTKDAREVIVPMCDMVKAALPEILHRAAQKGAIIGEGPDGLQIPATLRSR
jgi:hypothetical protein